MAAIITEKFRLHNAQQFFESFNETGLNEADTNNSNYYFFIGKPNSFIAADNNGVAGVSDSIPPLPIDDVTTENYVWDAMVGAKKINSTDIKYVIPRRNWSLNTVFDMYDDTIRPPSSTDPTGNVTSNGYTTLWESDFCFITSNYRVYKVLYNDKGNPYTGTEPNSDESAPFFIDNYMFKYMYTLTASEADRFLTTNFIPVPTDSSSELTDGDGKIHVVDIVNAGTGYTGTGPYYTPIKGDGTGAILKFYITNGSISDFGNGATDTFVLDDGTLAVEQQNTGYTYGYVDLSDVYSDQLLTTPFSLTNTGTDAVIRPIISPKGGHGSNFVAELGAHFVTINVQLNQSEGDDITVNNDFRQLGIVVDPFDYGDSISRSTDSTRRQTYAVHFSSTTGSGNFTIDEKITQNVSGETAVGRVVDWDSTNNILYYIQERHVDYGVSSTYRYYAFSGANNIVGSSSGTEGVIDTSNTSITLPNNNTITFTAGYCTPEMQPDSGNIIYLENRKPISRAEDQTEDIKITIEF